MNGCWRGPAANKSDLQKGDNFIVMLRACYGCTKPLLRTCSGLNGPGPLCIKPLYHSSLHGSCPSVQHANVSCWLCRLPVSKSPAQMTFADWRCDFPVGQWFQSVHLIHPLYLSVSSPAAITPARFVSQSFVPPTSVPPPVGISFELSSAAFRFLAPLARSLPPLAPSSMPPSAAMPNHHSYAM